MCLHIYIHCAGAVPGQRAAAGGLPLGRGARRGGPRPRGHCDPRTPPHLPQLPRPHPGTVQLQYSTALYCSVLFRTAFLLQVSGSGVTVTTGPRLTRQRSQVSPARGKALRHLHHQVPAFLDIISTISTQAGQQRWPQSFTRCQAACQASLQRMDHILNIHNVFFLFVFVTSSFLKLDKYPDQQYISPGPTLNLSILSTRT